MAKFNNNKKFDIDLSYGQFHEEIVANKLQNKKVEVKTEKGMWARTGNICLEYESWGKPSGIASTEADVWIHNLAMGDKVLGTLMFDVETLRKIVDKLSPRTVCGGDNNASRMYLVPINKLFTKDTVEVLMETTEEQAEREEREFEEAQEIIDGQ
jgi:hypothetical protein